MFEENISQNQPERDFKGIWIPKKVWLDKRLNALDKIILMEIDSLDCGERGCYASNEYLAEFCQCSKTKVSTAISKLIKLGYLYCQGFDGRQRELKSCLSKIESQGFENENLKISDSKNEFEPFKNCKAPCQNLKTINKENNILSNINARAREENKKEKNVPLAENTYIRTIKSERYNSSGRKVCQAPSYDLEDYEQNDDFYEMLSKRR